MGITFLPPRHHETPDHGGRMDRKWRISDELFQLKDHPDSRSRQTVGRKWNLCCYCEGVNMQRCNTEWQFRAILLR
jgi:hypothetical protein